MTSTKTVLSFYRYVDIENPVELQQQHLELCKAMDFKGRIFISEEGINGSIYGDKDSIEGYKKILKSNPLFLDAEFNEQITKKSPFKKLFVRLKKELVNSGLTVNFKDSGDYITPKELKEKLDSKSDTKEDIVLLDVRNDYETFIGKFKDAITLNLKKFRDLPELIYGIENLKNKKIVTYCTGGIRCEKASAFLKQNGFSDVSQLKGGILSFGKQFPDTYWQGKCFVFDDRLAIQMGDVVTEPLTKCTWCGNQEDSYLNCHNLKCDKLFICCEGCKEDP